MTCYSVTFKSDQIIVHIHLRSFNIHSLLITGMFAVPLTCTL